MSPGSRALCFMCLRTSTGEANSFLSTYLDRMRRECVDQRIIDDVDL